MHAFDAHIAATFPGEPLPRRDPPQVKSGGLGSFETAFLIALGVYVAVIAAFSGYVIRYSWLGKHASMARARVASPERRQVEPAG